MNQTTPTISPKSDQGTQAGETMRENVSASIMDHITPDSRHGEVLAFYNGLRGISDCTIHTSSNNKIIEIQTPKNFPNSAIFPENIPSGGRFCFVKLDRDSGDIEQVRNLDYIVLPDICPTISIEPGTEVGSIWNYLREQKIHQAAIISDYGARDLFI